MFRREFSGALVATGLMGQAVLAQAKNFEEGADFINLDKRLKTDVGAGKIEVVEFFWYSCSHCNAFEPELEAWIKAAPKDVVIRRVPVGFQENFIPQQRLFYVIEALGKLDELHRKVFYAIHVEKQTLNTQAAIGAWMEKQGVDKAKFDELYNSFTIATKVRKATQLQNDFKVEGVPALGIAGRFYTSGSMAQTMKRSLQVVDHLVAQVRQGR